MNDFAFETMGDGTIAWGDLMRNESTEEAKTCWASLEDLLEGWSIPDLSNSKSIETAFPFLLAPIDGGVKRRYAIVWNRAMYTAWRESHPAMTLDEWNDYDAFCEWRLMYALDNHARKYTVEEARSVDEICVVSFSEEVAIEQPAYTTPVRPIGQAALNALKNSPVSWIRDEHDPRIHHIKIHRAKCLTLGLASESVKKNLLSVLDTCDDCTISTAPSTEFLFTVTIGVKVDTDVVVEEMEEVKAVAVAVAKPTALSVLKNAPVSWDREGIVHHIKLHNKKIAYNKLNADHVIADLLTALKACPDCSVVIHTKPSNYICTVTII